MTLDEAIKHAEEVAEKNERRADSVRNRPIFSADFYHEEESCSKCAEEHRQLAEWLKELKAYREQRSERMNVEEKERLIKKDIESIENRVRHAFNQGYEMGLKKSSSENPNTCGDAISRRAAKKALEDRFIELQKRHSENRYETNFCLNTILELPSVTPQPKTGRWERMSDLPNDVDDRFECSSCGNVVHYRNVMDLRTFSRWCGRCGSDNG